LRPSLLLWLKFSTTTLALMVLLNRCGAFMSVPYGSLRTMHNDELPRDVPPLNPVRVALDQDVLDGMHVVVHGVLADVSVRASEEGREWAAGRVVDGQDSIEFITFPRAFARIDRSCFHVDRPVAVTARVSISAERKALVVNSIVHTDNTGIGHDRPL
jgi:DNA polymerase III alpha subunit